MADLSAQFGNPINDQAYGSRGLVMTMTAGQLERYEEEQRRESLAFTQTSPVITSLASHINMCWAANKSAKQPIERILLQCLRQRNGEYDPEVLTQLAQQGETDPIFMMVTDIKCRAFESWLKDIMVPSGEVPFFFQATPIPDLPVEMQNFAKARIVSGLQNKMAQAGITMDQITRDQVLEVGQKVKEELRKQLSEQATKEAEDITRQVNDQITEGGWYMSLEEIIEDIATFPTAFMKGPIVRKKRVLKWEAGQGGRSVPKVSMGIVREYKRVSPFDLYPSSGAKTLDDGNLIERIRYSPSDLQDMIGVEGFDEGAIRAVLNLYAKGGLKEWISSDTERAILQDHHNESGDPEHTIDCLKFMGNVQGQMLRDWGMDGVDDLDKVYPITAYMIGSFVISARINDNPLAKRNYFSASFVRKNDSIWGRGIPQVIRSIQRICNSAARALQRNMGIASGPMGWIIEDRIDPTQDVGKMHPWKLWRFTSGEVKNRTDLPMGFFNPQVIVNELLGIYKHFYDQASEISGIPAYVYGSEKIGGAGSTASGLSMLMNAAGKVMRGVAQHMDFGIIKPSVEAHWLHIMMYEPEKAAGDIHVIARASDYLMQLEQMQIAVNEALRLTGNPIDMQIIGLEGRGEMLREYMKRLKIPVDKVVPDREAIIQDSLQVKFAELIQTLSQALGIPPEQLMAIVKQARQGGGQQQQVTGGSPRQDQDIPNRAQPGRPANSPQRGNIPQGRVTKPPQPGMQPVPGMKGE